MDGLLAIGKHIANPATLISTDVAVLEKYAEKYPYAETFALLLLIALKKERSLDFEDYLMKYAFRISDRSRLFDLTHEVNDATSAQTTTEAIALTTEEVPSDFEPVVHEEDTSPPQELSIHSEDALEQNMLHHVYAQQYKLEELTASEELSLQQQQLEREVETPLTTPSITLKKSEFPARQTFTSWLHADANFSEAVQSIGAQRENTDVNEAGLYGEVSKPKKEFFSPTKKAKESLNEDKLPVSETLAKIYVLQGNYPKAISAYEQLILKIPEKKTFFANLISDLKKQLNS